MVTQSSAPPRIIHCSRFLPPSLDYSWKSKASDRHDAGSPSAREQKRNRNTNCTFFCARPRKTPAIIHFFLLSIQERKERRPTTFAYREIVSENDRGRRSHSLRIPTIFFVSGTKVKPWHPQPKKINETASELLLLSSSPSFDSISSFRFQSAFLLLLRQF